MITVHHLEHSRSQRLLWLLEELGLDYQVQRYARNEETKLAPPELMKVHPLGKSPVITDGDRTIAETGTIIEYILEKYGKGRFVPEADSAAYWQYKYWLHYAEGTLMPLMVLSLVMTRIETAKMPFFVKPIAKGIAANVRGGYLTPTLEKNVAMIESHLATHDWFAGEDLTGADFMMCYPLEAIAASGDGTPPAGIRAYIEKVQSRPGWAKALERGGPYDVLPR